MSRPEAEPALPLAGITVVEFSTSVAGPYAGMVLADLGAEVFKIEKPQGGDSARLWGPPFVDGVAPVFLALNRNKRSVAVDLKDPAQRDRLRAFIEARADVVIQNLQPGLMARLGLDAATLRARRPDLIYCDMLAFGAAGPKAAQPGYDPLMQACTGIMSVTGHPGDDAAPVRVGPSLVDQGSGMWAALSVLAALLTRARGGHAPEVSLSLYETALAWLPVQFANYLVTGNVPGKLGSENAGMAPYKAFEAADGWLVIAAGNDGQFRRLAEVLGAPELPADPRFATNPARVEHRGLVNETVQRLVAVRPRQHWLEALTAVGVPCAPVLSLDEVMADPQFAALDMLQDDPDREMRLMGLPVSFDGRRPPLRRGPPALGEATEAVVGQAGAEAPEEETR